MTFLRVRYLSPGGVRRDNAHARVPDARGNSGPRRLDCLPQRGTSAAKNLDADSRVPCIWEGVGVTLPRPTPGF